MSKPIREGKRPFKTGKQIGRVFIFIALGVAAIVATQLIIALMGEAHRAIHPEEAYIAGTKDEAPDYAIKNLLRSAMTPNAEYRYVIKDDVIFGVTLDPDHTSRTFVLIRDEKSRRFRPIDGASLLAMGENIYDLGFNGTPTAVCLYKDQGKYIIDVPVAGFPIISNAQPDKEIMDINEVEVYDNLGNSLEYIEGDNLKLYYYASEELPENYKVYMKYKNKEYLLLDTNKLYVFAGTGQRAVK